MISDNGLLLMSIRSFDERIRTATFRGVYAHLCIHNNINRTHLSTSLAILSGNARK